MPELPEVETIVRTLRRRLAGKVISSVRVLDERVLNVSAKSFQRRLGNRKVMRTGRRGKYALFFLDEGKLLVIHLGMSGQLLWVAAKQAVEKHTHLIFRFQSSRHELRFRDMRRFGNVFIESTHELEDIPYLAQMGPEADQVSVEELAHILRGRTRPVKSALMDQHLIAGLGNIYTDEALHRAKIHPCQPGGTLKQEEIAALEKAIKRVLDAAIRSQGSSIANYLTAEGKRGDFARFHRVYQRQGERCSRCGSIIRRTVLCGRGTHFCPGCQRLRRRRAPRRPTQ